MFFLEVFLDFTQKAKGNAKYHFLVFVWEYSIDLFGKAEGEMNSCRPVHIKKTTSQ